MRFILIDAKHRKVFDYHVPWQIDEQFICGNLRCDFANRIELTDDVDLWVSSDPKGYGFALPYNEPPIGGHGIVAGRSRLGDFKGLPIRISVEMVEKLLKWEDSDRLPHRVNNGRRYEKADQVSLAGLHHTLPQVRPDRVGGGFTAFDGRREINPVLARLQGRHSGYEQIAVGY